MELITFLQKNNFSQETQNCFEHYLHVTLMELSLDEVRETCPQSEGDRLYELLQSNEKLHQHLKKNYSDETQTKLANYTLQEVVEMGKKIKNVIGAKEGFRLFGELKQYAVSASSSSSSSPSSSSSSYSYSSSSSSSSSLLEGVISSARTSLTPQFEKGFLVISRRELEGVGDNRIGAGGCGTVSLAKYRGTSVAVKTFFPQDSTFYAELKAFQKLSHKNVCKLIGYSPEGENPQHVVMEYANLGSLDKALLGSEVAFEKCISIAIDIARGLRYLHSQDPPIMHRDLKPENILLRGDWSTQVTAFITDFGLSKAREGDSKTKSSTEGLGTPRWRATEVVDGRTSEASDVYGLGLILYNLYTKKVPFEKIPSHEITDAVRLGTRPEIPLKCPPVYANLMKKCWDDEQKKRPSPETIIRTLQKMQPRNDGFSTNSRSSMEEHTEEARALINWILDSKNLQQDPQFEASLNQIGKYIENKVTLPFESYTPLRRMKESLRDMKSAMQKPDQNWKFALSKYFRHLESNFGKFKDSVDQDDDPFGIATFSPSTASFWKDCKFREEVNRRDFEDKLLLHFPNDVSKKGFLNYPVRTLQRLLAEKLATGSKMITPESLQVFLLKEAAGDAKLIEQQYPFKDVLQHALAEFDSIICEDELPLDYPAVRKMYDIAKDGLTKMWETALEQRVSSDELLDVWAEHFKNLHAVIQYRRKFPRLEAPYRAEFYLRLYYWKYLATWMKERKDSIPDISMLENPIETKKIDLPCSPASIGISKEVEQAILENPTNLVKSCLDDEKYVKEKCQRKAPGTGKIQSETS